MADDIHGGLHPAKVPAYTPNRGSADHQATSIDYPLLDTRLALYDQLRPAVLGTRCAC